MRRLAALAFAALVVATLFALPVDAGPSESFCARHPNHHRCTTTTTTTTTPTTTTTTLPPTTTTTTTPPGGLPPGVTLRAIDGGTSYYGQFSNPLPDDPSFFPIGVWGAYAHEDANVALDKSRGINTYVWAADPNPGYLTNIREAGMHAILDKSAAETWAGSETVGRLTEDEWDMRCGGADSCYSQLEALIAGLPQDGRALYANYGKGLIFGWPWLTTEAQAQRYVNGTASFGRYQDIVSADVYWHTDPFQEDRGSRGYGETVRRVRSLDGADGVRQPVWNFVEVTCPWNECNSLDQIPTPAEIRGAVWHSIIAGARGIEYFQHAFAGPCPTHHALRDTQGCYTANQQAVTTLNGQIAQLAPVLNAPFADGYIRSATGAVQTMAKQGPDGAWYVFAAADGAGSVSEITVAEGCNVEVLFEARNLTCHSGAGQEPAFSDSFADGNAVHIYRIT
jgi:hypothetical protein